MPLPSSRMVKRTAALSPARKTSGAGADSVGRPHREVDGEPLARHVSGGSGRLRPAFAVVCARAAAAAKATHAAVDTTTATVRIGVLTAR